MKKIIVLCSALVFGLCSESYAWLVDLNEIADDGKTTIGKEPFTPKLSLVAVQERMTRLRAVSGDSGLAQRVFRRLYNSWLSDNSKWTGQGRNSTIDNIQGYCSSAKLDDFQDVLKEIEDKINEVSGTSSTEVEDAVSALEIQKATNQQTAPLNLDISEQGLEATQNTTEQELQFQLENNPTLRELERQVAKMEAEEDSKSTVQTAELEVDAADALRESDKIQRNALETAANAMEASLYDDPPTIDINFTSFDLRYLAALWGDENIGVDVDEDFIVSLRRAWSMQALNMSVNAIQARVDTKNGEQDDYGNQLVIKTYQAVDPNTFTNADIATFLLNHFRNTDTYKRLEGTYDYSGIEGTGKDGKTLLQNLLDQGVNISNDQTEEKMKFHLNIVTRMLQEISKEKDEISATGEPYEVDSIVFHAFRQYMTQALREAITLIKADEE